MNKKLVFKSTEPGEDFNRPSEVIAYASRVVSQEMTKAFRQFRETSNGTNEIKHKKLTKIAEKP